MPTLSGSDPVKLKEKYAAVLLCWSFAMRSFLPWNNMLTIEDYYMMLFSIHIHPLSQYSLHGMRLFCLQSFYFTAKYGDQGWMLKLTSLLGLTNGYLTVCFLTTSPKGYKGLEQNALGNLLVLFFLGIVFATVTLDWLWLIGKGSVCIRSQRYESEIREEAPGLAELQEGDTGRAEGCGGSDGVGEKQRVGKVEPQKWGQGGDGRGVGRYAAVTLCWILGIGALLSWNSMLTIEDYYMILFPNYHPSRVLTLVYQPFAFGTISILVYYEAKLNTRIRNLFGYILFFLSSLMVLILALATSGKGGIGYYIGLCVISGCFGVADALVEGGMVGDLSFMSSEMVQSFLAGLAASGTLTSALGLITKAAFSSSGDGLRKGALLFFGITSFIELLCVLLYVFTFPKLPIVKYYHSKAASEGAKTVSANFAAGDIETQPSRVYPYLQNEEDSKLQERLGNKELIFQNIDYAFDLFLIYALTLSIFPGFLAEDTGSHSLGSWYDIVLSTMYNVCDLIGRYVPLIKGLMMKSRMGLLIVILLRFLFVPAFYFTAKYGDQGWMLMLTSLLGLTNGYLTVCVLTAAPKGYKGPEQNALGNLLILFLLGGIFAGVTLDWLWLIGKVLCGGGGGDDESFSHKNPKSSESLQLYTEGLGSESADDVEDFTPRISSYEGFVSDDGNTNEEDENEEEVMGKSRATMHFMPSFPGRSRNFSRRSSFGSGSVAPSFPPPISCIGRSGKPWVCFRSYLRDSRFILKEIRIPTQEFLRSCQEDGRLKLRFVQPDEEIPEEEEEGEEEDNVVDDEVLDAENGEADDQGNLC
ncbi:hypothetical protein NE237_002284 [Protea cynaroides]|uniref:FAF domain-containing protein n=1 Tax=Protea cynaroides TaxID=273540 RepID=A0A9Q0KUR7_9MAGN|nr:hypothetical protein NE237_002284 [Protea cynaroides]